MQEPVILHADTLFTGDNLSLGLLLRKRSEQRKNEGKKIQNISLLLTLLFFMYMVYLCHIR